MATPQVSAENLGFSFLLSAEHFLPQNHMPSLVPCSYTEGSRPRSSQQQSGHRSEAWLEEPGCRVAVLGRAEGVRERLAQAEPGQRGRSREKAFICPLVPFTVLLNTYHVTGTVVGAGVQNRGFGACRAEFKFQLHPWAHHLTSLCMSILICKAKTLEHPAH